MVRNEQLVELTEFEQFLKKYYTEAGDFFPFSEIYKNKERLKSNLKKVDKSIETNYIEEIHMKEHGFELMETNFFVADEDVCIKKHPRYLYPALHQHDFFEVAYVLTGHCTNLIDGRKVTMNAGELCIIPPKVEHSIEVATDETIILNLLVKSSTFDHAFTSLLKSEAMLSQFFNDILYSNKYQKYFFFNTEKDALISDLIRTMLGIYEAKSPHYNWILNGYFMVLMGSLLQRHEKNLEYPPGYFDKEYDISKVLNYMRINFKGLTLEQCAEEFNFRPRHLSILLKKSTNKSFPQLMTITKMEVAKDMLANRPISIEKLADKLGYNDASYFTKVFKKEVGKSPGEYRNGEK